MRCFTPFRQALLCALLALAAWGGATAADPVKQASLALEGQISSAGDFVDFSWPRAVGTKVGRVGIQRRVLGETGYRSWQDLGSARGFARIFRDETTQPGIAYEYRFLRPSKELIETGYWATGLQLPAEEIRGVALVVVDETLAEELAPRLDRFVLDLIGDGWKVVRHQAPRGDKRNAVANLKTARKVRAWIQDRYNSAHYLPHALILVGHVPVVRSGLVRPDGHAARPIATDLFYAESNGVWSDNGEGVLAHNTVPSDYIEMQVGRIDFATFDDALGDEVTLLKRYFDKNHHWRHGRLGDLRQAYGDSTHLFVELNALRNIVGPENFVSGGHHDTGTRQPWLFGVDFGSSDYSKYLAPTPVKAIFTINFGSSKPYFTRIENEMVALLAQPWYGLTSGWGARPAWQLHHMALGKSIGYSHLRTVNNGTLSTGGTETLEYTPTGNYSWVNPVWVNLLGDPTLRPFPLNPVTKLRAELSNGRVKLEWVAPQSAGEVQYRVYRSADRFGPYRALNPAKLLGGNRYIDDDPKPGAWYMVRAHALKKVHAGSFYRYAQGAFAVAGQPPSATVDQTLSTPMGQPLKISLPLRDPGSGKPLVASFIKDVDGGRLLLVDGAWAFVPDSGFSGHVDIPFSQFDGIATDQGLISIDVLKP